MRGRALPLASIVLMLLGACKFPSGFVGGDASPGTDSSTSATDSGGTDSGGTPGDMDGDMVPDAMDCAPNDGDFSTEILDDPFDNLDSLDVESCTWTSTGGFADIEDSYPCPMAPFPEWAYALVMETTMDDVRAETSFRFDADPSAGFPNAALVLSGNMSRDGYYCEVQGDGEVRLGRLVNTVIWTLLDVDFTVPNDAGKTVTAGGLIDIAFRRLGDQLRCEVTFPGGTFVSLEATDATLTGSVALSADRTPADYDFIRVCGPTS